MAEKKVKECNISPELWEAWKKNLRTGDKQKMAAEFGYSLPTITSALKYGHVNSPELPGLITKYFKTRLDAEADDAKGLTQQ